MIAFDDVVITCGHLGAPLECHTQSIVKEHGKDFIVTSFQKSIRQFIIVYLGSFISAVGILGSIICLLIFFRTRLAVPTTHYLLVASSLVDLVYIVFEAIVHHPSFIAGNRNGTQFGSYVFLGVVRSGINLSQLLRNWIIICLGFERYLLVCHPVYFRSQWKMKHIHLLMTFGVALCIIVRIPYILSYIFDIWGPEWCKLSGTTTAIHTIADVIFVAFLPVPLLAVMSLIVIAESNRLQAWRGKMMVSLSANQAKMKNANRRAHQAIMVVVFCFTLFTGAFLPNGVLRLLQYKGAGNICKIYFYRQFTAAMVFIGSLLNSSVNFFVYFVYWARFRRVVGDTMKEFFPFLRAFAAARARRKSTISFARVSSIFNTSVHSTISKGGSRSGREYPI
nr:Orphan Rhodopsin-like G protein-coupled receptor [Hymenolepis microstoma]